MFFKPDKFQNHCNEGKRKGKKQERRERKRRREKNNGCTLSFYNSYFGDSYWTQKVHLVITFWKIRLDIKRKIKKGSPLYPPPPPPTPTTHTNWYKRTFFDQIHSVNVTKFPLPVQRNATNKSVPGWLWQSARSVSSVREYISLGLIFARLFGINAQSWFVLEGALAKSHHRTCLKAT